jgi:hypothetical protein
MAKKIKQMRFSAETIERINGIAEQDHDGNFTAAVESLIHQSLVTRSLDQSVRWHMYEGAKKVMADQYDEKNYANLIRDSLQSLHL